jgi:pyrimidine-nucleoside phosphorylase
MRFDDACEMFRLRRVERFDEASDAVVQVATRGLTDDQVAVLAESLSTSGEKVELPANLGPFADVPSTGGPGSLSTLICPLLIASTGVRVPKLSVPGSIAGGIDTMAILPGFKSKLVGCDFIEALGRAGIAHAEPSRDFCPADASLIKSRRKSQMMANAPLAAASLFAKKLAIPNTAACFDFRVGPTGNIGADVDTGLQAGNLFCRVARKLGVAISIALTDNRIFPCSAVGRLESLDLMWSMLNGHELRPLIDRVHVDTCIRLAAEACVLVRPGVTLESVAEKIRESLLSGAAKKTLEAHLEAQGSSVKSLEMTLALRAKQRSTIVVSLGRGYWVAPDLATVKNWAKRYQAIAEKCEPHSEDLRPRAQIGVRLLISPGEKVEQSQPVIEIRYPEDVPLPQGFEFLEGSTEENAPAASQQILGYLRNDDHN